MKSRRRTISALPANAFAMVWSRGRHHRTASTIQSSSAHGVRGSLKFSGSGGKTTRKDDQHSLLHGRSAIPHQKVPRIQKTAQRLKAWVFFICQMCCILEDMKYKFTFKFAWARKHPDLEACCQTRRQFPSHFIKRIGEGESHAPNFISYKLANDEMMKRYPNWGAPKFYMLKFNFYLFTWGFYISKVITEKIDFNSPTYTNFEKNSRHVTLSNLNRMWEARMKKQSENHQLPEDWDMVEEIKTYDSKGNFHRFD